MLDKIQSFNSLVDLISEKYYETQDIDSDVLEYAKSKGYDLEAFHGSWERHLKEISKMKTSYGLFFSPDPITSSGYAGDAGKLYHVLLYRPENSKILDLTNESIRNNFFKKHFSSGKLNLTSKEINFYGRYDTLSEEDIIKKITEETEENDDFKSFLIQQLNLKEDSDVDDISFELEYDSDKLFELLNFENVFKLFSDKYYISDEQLNDIHNLYNTNMQEFYMEYQDEMLKSAEGDGYELVIFDDPATSGGGESISFVVFDPTHIKLADENTFDDNGEKIPLHKRFDISKKDIRF